MGILDVFIGKKGIQMVAGIGVVPKEIIEVSQKDPVIEGKKRGYQQAAKEYEPIYAELKEEYDLAKKIFKEQLIEKDKQLDQYILVLERLENEKKNLETKLKLQQEKSEINVSNTSGMLYLDFSFLLKNHPKFDKAKIDGYNEAKAIYEKKISSLKSQLKKLKNEADKVIAENQELILITLSEISKLKIAIAELKLIKQE